jgi:FKBP-type peptidyl-prolyl cis-trans isomerase
MKYKIVSSCLAVSAILVMCGCGGEQAQQSTTTSTSAPPSQGLLDPSQSPAGTKDAANDPSIKTTPSGLQYKDMTEGTGAVAQPGQSVTVHYTGWLKSDGTKFDSSVDRGEPFTFQLGGGQVIKGWDEGVAGMKIGGKRRLVIPANLAYGDSSPSPKIPPGSPLVFDVELLGTQAQPAQPGYRTE